MSASDVPLTWVEPGEFIDQALANLDPPLVRADLETPENAPYYDIARTDSEAAAENSEIPLIRSQSDYIPPDDRDLFRHLHSRMRNDFYKMILETIMQERWNVHDRAYILRSIYNMAPMGDQEDFLLKYSNAMILMNAKFPTYFKKYVGASDPNFLIGTEAQENRNLDLQNRYLRRLLYSEYLVRRYAGSRYAYNANFARLEQPGTIYLRLRYEATELGDPYYGKFYRSRTDSDRTQIVPGGGAYTYDEEGNLVPYWPDTPSYLRAKKNYSAEFDPLAWDTRREWDEGFNPNLVIPNPTPPPATIPDTEGIAATRALVPEWDNKTSVSPGGKGLILEFTLDKPYYHLNSDGSTFCLIDEPWFLAMDDLLKSSGRVGDTTMIGSQLSLVANNGGYVSLYTTDDPYDDHRDTYTHPNTLSRFQLLTTNWFANPTVSRVVIGTGGPDCRDTEIDDYVAGVEGPPKYYDAFWVKAADTNTPVAARLTLTITSAATGIAGSINITVPGGTLRSTALDPVTHTTAALVATAVFTAHAADFDTDGWTCTNPSAGVLLFTSETAEYIGEDDLTIAVVDTTLTYTNTRLAGSDGVVTDKIAAFTERVGTRATLSVTLSGTVTANPDGIFSIQVPGGVLPVDTDVFFNDSAIAVAARIYANHADFEDSGWSLADPNSGAVLTFTRILPGSEADTLTIDDGSTGVTASAVTKVDGLPVTLPESPIFSTNLGVKETKVAMSYVFADAMCHKIAVDHAVMSTDPDTGGILRITLPASGTEGDPDLTQPALAAATLTLTITSGTSVPPVPEEGQSPTPRPYYITLPYGLNKPTAWATQMSTTAAERTATTGDDTAVKVAAKIYTQNVENFARDGWILADPLGSADLVFTCSSTGSIGTKTLTIDPGITDITSSLVKVDGTGGFYVVTPIFIELPHANIAPGTCYFDVKMTVPVSATQDDTIIIKVSERYNSDMREFNPIATIWKEIGGLLYPFEDFRLVEYMTDMIYSEEDAYFPHEEDAVIDIYRRDPATTTPALGRVFSAADIDYTNGTLKLYVELNREGCLGARSPDKTSLLVDCEVTCTYAINSYGSTASLKQVEESSSLKTAITEIGVYNTDGDLVAYGCFPPVIYNPDIRHLSFNLALELPPVSV